MYMDGVMKMKKSDDVLLIIDLNDGEQIKGIISDEAYKRLIYKYNFNTTSEQRELARNGKSFESIMEYEKNKAIYGGKSNGFTFNKQYQMKEIELANKGMDDKAIQEEMTWRTRWDEL